MQHSGLVADPMAQANLYDVLLMAPFIMTHAMDLASFKLYSLNCEDERSVPWYWDQYTWC